MNKQTAIPLAMLGTAFFAMLALTPVLSRPLAGEAGQGRQEASVPTGEGVEGAHVSAAAEKTFERLHEATELLLMGQDAAAARIVDGMREEKLIVRAGDYGQGALKSFSTTTLLMRLVRTMASRAETAADAGDRVAALAWVGRCRALSRQLLATPSPNLDALKVARYADTMAGRAEVALRRRWDGPTLANAIERREKQLTQVWREVVLTRIMDTRHENAQGTLKKERESEIAADLISFYQTQRTAAFVMLGDEEGTAQDSVKRT